MAGRTNRRLAAILAADVVGYSRMMAADEAGTLAALKRHREVVFGPAVAQHQGRIVKLIGDGTLVEFGSVVDAVNCALSVQRTIAAETTTGLKITLRIGINLGDVIIEGDDIYGDGVNVAARLESLADQGGICIASIVKESAGNRIDVVFADAGEVEVKNVERPVRIWKWSPASINIESAAPSASRKTERSDVPLLAVLPFQNMSGDAEQEYFADGVVEDLITALSRFKSFAVIARNSSFIYKGRSVDVRQVGKELGARYVLEGSVRRSGNRLRITGQLVEAMTGAHLWADKFDGAVEDIFDVQDKITESVVAVVEPQIQHAEIKRSRSERPESLAAYDLHLRAVQKLNLDRPEENAAALQLLERAIALEPGYALALGNAAYGYEHRVSSSWPALTEDDAKRSLQLARAALAVAEGDATVLARCGMALILIGRDYEQGLLMVTRAVESNPNNLTAIFVAGYANHVAGSREEALKFFTRAIRLSPSDTSEAMGGAGQIQMCLENYEEGLKLAERSLAMNPSWRVSRYTAIVCNVYLGRMEEAKRAMAALLELEPTINLAQVRSAYHTRDPHRNDTLIEGLRRAGMPET
jgi:adenylate cyclase